MKTKKELINTIPIVPGNLEYCAENNIINGNLYAGIERIMEEYASQRPTLSHGEVEKAFNQHQVDVMRMSRGEISEGHLSELTNKLISQLAPKQNAQNAERNYTKQFKSNQLNDKR